ncbi:hypothetical protein GN956_G7478 [Arapaima gigas]
MEGCTKTHNGIIDGPNCREGGLEADECFYMLPAKIGTTHLEQCLCCTLPDAQSQHKARGGHMLMSCRVPSGVMKEGFLL